MVGITNNLLHPLSDKQTMKPAMSVGEYLVWCYNWLPNIYYTVSLEGIHVGERSLQDVNVLLENYVQMELLNYCHTCVC